MIRIAMIVLSCAGGLLLVANYTVLQCGCKVVIAERDKEGRPVLGEDGGPIHKLNPQHVLHQQEQNNRTFAALGLIATGLLLPLATRAFSGRRARGEETDAPRDAGGTPHGG